LIDVGLATLLLALAAPLLLLAMILIRLTSPGPAIFVQRRAGHLGREFQMYKLRTMADGSERAQDALAADGTFFKLKDDPRVTLLGGVLRKTSIDELPQLVNVIRGDMSLVGPRPLLPADVRNFPRDSRALRFDMRPGMTGLWQVSGRNDVSDGQRMELDREYVAHWSLSLDARILLRTPSAVLSGRGAC
jgi:lipopolysaccharide/colanic/teichoic acid biosynthesis glycosyltransferase